MASQAKISVKDETSYPGTKIVYASGQLDESNLSELSSNVDPLILDDEVKFIILNFARLEYLNSKVIGYIANLIPKIADSEKQLVISEANKEVLDILDLVGLTTLIPCYSSDKDALDSIEED